MSLTSSLGSPTWGYLGAVATGFIVYFGREYAHHCVYRGYESADGKRLGFQMYTVLGYPGRKIEVSIGKAKILSPAKVVQLLEEKRNLISNGEEVEDIPKKGIVGFLESLSSQSSTVPVRVEGIEGNLLIDHHAEYSNDFQLLDMLLLPHGIMPPSNNATSARHLATPAQLDKEHRANWRREATAKRKNKKGMKTDE